MSKTKLRAEICSITEILSELAEAKMMSAHTRVYNLWMLSVEDRLPVEMPESWYELLWERVCNPTEHHWKITDKLIRDINERYVQHY